MQLVHADELEWKRGLEHRGGTFHSRELMDGEQGTLGNFQFSLGRIQGDFNSPRHRHNFDQFRFQIEGEADFARNGVMGPGCLGYFPEGVPYGPQSAGQPAITAVLQFGAASGSSYLSREEVAAGRKSLEKTGTFKDGVYTRNEGVSGRRNTDGYQAIWEHHNGRTMVYPKPRYRDPIMLDTANFEWVALDDGVEEKMLGTFTERRTQAQMLRIMPGCLWRATERSVYLVLEGAGEICAGPYREFSSFHLKDGEREVDLRCDETTVLIRFGLPDLSGLVMQAERVSAVVG